MHPPPLHRNRVLLFGDSLTAGNYLPADQKSHLWVSLLAERWQDSVEFINEGKGGRATDCIEEFVEVLATHSPPHLLVLWLGTNDSRDTGPDTVARATRNLRCMIRQARTCYGEDLPILLVAPPNIHPAGLVNATPGFAKKRQANLRAIAQAIVELALLEGCESISLHGVLSGLTLTSDGVHPSAEGNADMAHALALKLANFLPVRRLSNVNTNRQHRKGWK